MFMTLPCISELHIRKFHYLKVLLFLIHNSTDRACHSGNCRHTYTHTEAHALMAKECLERSHLDTLKYTPPHLYFRHMHSRLRCSVKVNWAVETKELRLMWHNIRWILCPLPMQSGEKELLFWLSHSPHVWKTTRIGVKNCCIKLFFFSYTVQWLFGAEPTSSFTGSTGIQTFQVVW